MYFIYLLLVGTYLARVSFRDFRKGGGQVSFLGVPLFSPLLFVQVSLNILLACRL